VPDNLVLIGFSGTGKSAVGRLIAARLGWNFVDVDERLVGYFGKPIAAVFREEGEAAFRAAERAAVVEACAGRYQVISVGGGAVVDPVTRERVRDGNRIARLEASPETILTRLRSSPTAEERPMLAADDPLARIRDLLDARADAYAIADFAVDTEGRAPVEVADEVVRHLRTSGGRH
jgi:shikimate kinase